MSDLDKLIAAVEAGDIAPFYGEFRSALGETLRDDGVKAFDGSLDAAMRLHEALLPGWEFWLKQNHTEFSCAVAWDGIWHSMIRAEAPTPARAWLLAILRALKAKGEA